MHLLTTTEAERMFSFPHSRGGSDLSDREGYEY